MPSTEGRQLRLPVNLSPEVKVYLVLFQWAYLLAEVLILVIRLHFKIYHAKLEFRMLIILLLGM